MFTFLFIPAHDISIKKPKNVGLCLNVGLEHLAKYLPAL